MSQQNKSLAHAIALATCTAGFAYGVILPSAVLGFPIAVGAGLAFNAYRKRHRLDVKALLGECIEASTPLLESTAQSLKDADPAISEGVITKYGHKLLLKLLGEHHQDDFAWFVDAQFGLGESGLLPYGNWLICGEQREGKSMVARHLFSRYLDQHPGSAVMVLDVERESHPDGYWFGLDVADSPEMVLQAFQQIRRYLDESKGDGSDSGLVVIFDEVKTTLNALDSKAIQFVNDTLQDIHSKGAKRKVLVLSIMHTLQGGILNWQGITDFAPKSNILMLQRFAADDSNFRNLQPSPSQMEARQQIGIEKILPLASTEPRPCLLYSDKQWAMRWIPKLEEPNLEITDSEPETEDEFELIREWISGVELPENEVLTLNKLLALCGVSSSRHKTKGTELNECWNKYLEFHNSRVLPELEPTEPPT